MQRKNRSFNAYTPRITHGKQSLQILFTGEKHFVNTSFLPGSDCVIVFDSLGQQPTVTLKKQLKMLYGSNRRKILLKLPQVQRQSPSSNNCGVSAAAFAVDIAFSLECGSAKYIDSRSQRKWFHDCLHTGDVMTCPRTEAIVKKTFPKIKKLCCRKTRFYRIWYTAVQCW